VLSSPSSIIDSNARTRRTARDARHATRRTPRSATREEVRMGEGE
jgi:hypothetical protein